MKKINILITLFLLITLITTISQATYNNVTMSIVEEPKCTIDFGTNSTVEKSLISKDLDNKELNLQIKVTNNEENLKPVGEIMLVIDNSESMLTNISETQTRKDLIINSSKTLITNLLKDNTQLKIGVVSFSTNSNISKEGTIEDAKLISELTNDSSQLISKISNIQYEGPRTNLQAGINLAKQYFSKNDDTSNKYVIVLSDGIPNVAINYDKIYFSDDVIAKTKNELESLKDITQNVYVMLTGISNGDTVVAPSNKTYNEIINSIFGTTAKPTIGKFYYITDDKIENTITSDIYKDLLPISQSFTNIKITDYFPDEIVNNFDFSYVKKPNIGTISSQIDTTTNSIIWEIPELKSGETAIIEYKLKLKENFDKNIIDKIINTNEKLDLSYTDFYNKTNTKTSDISPKIKLTEEKQNEENSTPQNSVVEKLPTTLPKAGTNTFFGIILITIIIAIAFGIKYITVKNSIK